MKEEKIGHFGLVNYDFSVREGQHEKYCFLIFVYIHPKFRKMGYGTAMMKEAINLSFNCQKCDAIELKVVCSNQKAIALYQKLGFVQTEQYTSNNFPKYTMFLYREKYQAP